MTDADPGAAESRVPRRLLAVVILLFAGIAGLWLARRPLSEAAVARYFAGEGIAARYRVTAVSPSGVTLDDVVLGPASAPDFTADRVEARIGWSPLRPWLDTVRLARPRVRLRVTADGVSFGSLDRLIPARGPVATPLPDIALTIEGGRIDAATPFGPLAATIDGRGRLARDFAGSARIDPARLRVAGCPLGIDGGTIVMATRPGIVRLVVDGRADRVACAGAAARGVVARLVVVLPPTLDRYDGDLTATAGSVAVAGVRAGATRLVADARAAALVAPALGRFTASTTNVAATRGGAARIAATGDWRIAGGDMSAAGDVRLTAARMIEAGTLLRGAAPPGTLAAPLMATLAARVTAAARDFDVTARIAASRAGGVAVSDARIVARSGARLQQRGTVARAGSSLRMTGGATIDGGGLPSLTVDAEGTVADDRATLTIARWAVPGASLDALRVAARAEGGGVTLDGAVRVSGALGGGVFARGLGVPIALRIDRGGVALTARCAAANWTQLSRATVRIDRGQARACFDGTPRFGSRTAVRARIDPLLLTGTSDGQPLRLTSSAIDATLAGSRVSIAGADIAARLGARGIRGRVDGAIDLATLTGGGTVAGAALDDTALPVGIDAVSGRWRLAGGRADLTAGSARVTDRALPARFEPMRLADGAAMLDGDRLTARGDVRLAAGDARLFGFTATQDLATATGHADLATGRLVFDAGLQPDQIVPALRGIVANVRGPIDGTGRIAWAGERITSSGQVTLDGLALATAALGPVDGIGGTIMFDDLLALTTPPGQQVRIARINPGVAVDDGLVTFRMLAPDAAAIESIVWPYAGGTLTLAPVTIRSGDVRRTFTLTVDDLDAEAFLQRFEIKNLNVTGRFDGTLPLVFDGDRGRIAGGRLVARAGGGLVQYVGEVGREDLGAGARLAFDALRRLRYRSLALDLDGDLDGELVTGLRFDGVNEAPTRLGGGLPITATGLPFRFTVSVRAPFRALLGTAASFGDVRPLLRGEVQPR